MMRRGELGGGRQEDVCNPDTSCDSPSEEMEPTNEYFLIPDGFARISSDRQADSLWGKEKGRPHVHMHLIV